MIVRRQALSVAVAFGPALLGLLGVGRRAPAVGGQQEVVDLGRRRPRSPERARPSARSSASRAWPSCAGVQVSRRAPISELPRRRCRPNHGACRPAMHGVEPQRDLGELDGGGVEVDAVARGAGRVGLHLLQLARVLRPGRSGRRARFCRRVRYCVGELVDRLDERTRRSRAPARRWSGRGSSAAVVVSSWSSSSSSACVDDEAGEHLGRVVRALTAGARGPTSRNTKVPGGCSDRLAARRCSGSVALDEVHVGRSRSARSTGHHPASPWPGRRPWRPRTGRSSAKKPV